MKKKTKKRQEMQNKSRPCVPLAHLRLWFQSQQFRFLRHVKKEKKPHGRRCETARRSNQLGTDSYFLLGSILFLKKRIK